MKIYVDLDHVDITEYTQIESGEYNTNKINFIFTPEYKDLVKVAIFGCKLDTDEPKFYKIYLSDDSCYFPLEVTTTSDVISIGIYAFNVDNGELKLRYSPTPVKTIVYEGSFREEAENASSPTPTEIEQIMSRIVSLEDITSDLNTRVEALENKACDLDSIKTRVDKLEDDVEGISGRVDTIESDIDDLEGDIANTYSKTEVDSLLGSKVDTSTYNSGQAAQDEKIAKAELILSQLPKVTGEGTNFSLSPTIEYDLEVESLLGDTYQTNAILPSEYQQVEYIESTGTQWIETNVTGEATWNLQTEGTATSSSAQILLARYHDGGYWLGITSQNKYGTGTQSSSQYIDINGNTKQEIVINATNTSLRATIGSLTCSRNMTTYDYIDDSYTLLASGNSPSTSRFYANAKLYYAKCYQNNTLVRDFIPCYRISDNVIGLYDLVGKQFYINSGSGSFTKGSNVSIPNPNYPQDIQVVTGTQEIKIGNKNLIYLGTKRNGYRETTHGTFVETANEGGNVLGYYFKTSQIPDTVTISSTNGNRCNLSYYNEIPTNGLLAQEYSNQNVNSRTVSINKSYPYVHIQFSYNQEASQPQVEEGSTKTDYIEPTSISYTLHLGDEELAKIGTYQDKIYYEGGKWYKYSAILKTTLNSTMCSSVTASASYGTLCYLNFNGKVDNTNICAMSNKFVGVSYDNRTSLPTGYRVFTSDGSGAVTIRFPNNSTIDTLQEVKDFVDNNEIEVRYITQNATTTEITNTTLLQDLNYIKEHIKSYSDTTNISTSGNLPIIITASALKQLS